jgi:hypothetical protein
VTSRNEEMSEGSCVDPASAAGGEQAAGSQALKAWVSEQLAAFAPLEPAELVVLAAILDYDAAAVPGEAA